MADEKQISDIEVYDRIAGALDALGNERAATKTGNKILNAARSILSGCLLTMTRAMTPTADLWPPKPKPPDVKADAQRD
jgi:hypothetical protein